MLIGSAIAPAAALSAGGAAAASDKLAELETRSGGRLGVAILDTETGRRLAHRGDERFALCSTFKALAAACVLARVDRGADRLDRRIVVTPQDVLSYAPIAKAHVGPAGMTMAALCEAAITLSDNTAANLLLATFGGPAGLTRYLRSLGDSVTRLDRIEPALNEAQPGDPRDTTTPSAMLEDFRRLLLGDALAPQSRDRLAGWLVACQTGGHRLRGGLPAAWRIGDKTGSGMRGTTNDVAIAFPPNRAPLIIAAYLTETTASEDARAALFAEIGRLAVDLAAKPG
ncbi:MAG TPA: class A beta-lactamase [Stellaceae bacterium]|jgi:beta-lactamase class A|nr:class A beta-lactamase [Stellaceae bacterium]